MPPRGADEPTHAAEPDRLAGQPLREVERDGVHYTLLGTAHVSKASVDAVRHLINSRDFLAALSNGVFLATQYIRHHSTPLYTPEPDVCHELAGHAAQLASPLFAELNREVGRAALRTDTDEQLQRLANIYWFTIEFGVLREEGQVKAYGAGLLSSFGELEAMSDARIEEMANWELMETQLYDVTQYQPVLFCAPSFEAMVEQLTRRLQRWPNAAN